MEKKSKKTAETATETATETASASKGGRRERPLNVREIWMNAALATGNARTAIAEALDAVGSRLKGKGMDHGSVWMIDPKNARQAAKLMRAAGIEPAIGSLGGDRLVSVAGKQAVKPVYVFEGSDGWTNADHGAAVDPTEVQQAMKEVMAANGESEGNVSEKGGKPRA